MSMRLMKHNAYNHFPKEHQQKALRFMEQVELVLERGIPQLTPFLNETEQEVFKKVVGKKISYQLDGGCVDALRKRACLSLTEFDCQIVCLRAKKSKFDSYTHKDCMGALYNCGTRSDQIGDIYCDENQVVVYVASSVAQYIIDTVTSIGRSSIHFERTEDFVRPVTELAMKQYIISSTRLDCLVSAVANVSRSKASSMIQAKMVQINHTILEDCAYLCDNNSILSIRGIGRFKFLGILKSTKKDRIVVSIGKYC